MTTNQKPIKRTSKGESWRKNLPRRILQPPSHLSSLTPLPLKVLVTRASTLMPWSSESVFQLPSDKRLLLHEIDFPASTPPMVRHGENRCSAINVSPLQPPR